MVGGAAVVGGAAATIAGASEIGQASTRENILDAKQRSQLAAAEKLKASLGFYSKRLATRSDTLAYRLEDSLESEATKKALEANKLQAQLLSLDRQIFNLKFSATKNLAKYSGQEAKFVQDLADIDFSIGNAKADFFIAADALEERFKLEKASVDNHFNVLTSAYEQAQAQKEAVAMKTARLKQGSHILNLASTFEEGRSISRATAEASVRSDKELQASLSSLNAIEQGEQQVLQLFKQASDSLKNNIEAANITLKSKILNYNNELKQLERRTVTSLRGLSSNKFKTELSLAALNASASAEAESLYTGTGFLEAEKQLATLKFNAEIDQISRLGRRARAEEEFSYINFVSGIEQRALEINASLKQVEAATDIQALQETLRNYTQLEQGTRQFLAGTNATLKQFGPGYSVPEIT